MANKVVHSTLEVALDLYKQHEAPRGISPTEEGAFRKGYSACLSDFVRMANESKSVAQSATQVGR